jgi:carbamoyltransferase
MSKIISISATDDHDAGAALIVDGQIKFVIEEEKLTGIKSIFNIVSFPTKSLEAIEKATGVNLFNCDYIVSPRITSPTVFPEIYKTQEIFSKFKSYSHHMSHCLGSYFTCGMKGKVISLSLDGAGLRSKSKIYLCENGSYDLVHSSWRCISSSLASLWGFTTQWMGWTMIKDEGKVVGLAAHGKVDPKIYEYLSICLYYDDLTHKGTNWQSMFYFILNKLQRDGWFDDAGKRATFAATLQKFSEDEVYKLLLDLKKLFPEYKKICLSGGLFANVKLNQFINQSGLYEEIYIHPAMSDAGLALGAALIAANELEEIKEPLKPNDVFWGESFSKEYWEALLSNYLSIKKEPFNLQRASKLIDDGKVIGVFQGRTEYGPRALGNRSIIVKATDPETHKKLNQRLRRTEIMPFAPSVLSGYEEEIFDCAKSKYAAEFMTLCYNTKENWVSKIPAVVHPIDKSARPQIVRKEANEFYYNLIESYRQISGLPIVLNTSFNAHGEPINNYPDQVLRHLLDGSVDYIITEDFIIYLQ